MEGLRLYSIIISKYYTPAVRGLRLKEKVRLTAANMNLTKPQLLNKEGGRWRVVLPQTLVLRRRLSTIKQ